jgi:hypothetical protein
MSTQRRIITADCETDPFSHGEVIAPFIWGAYDGVDYWEFGSTEDFVAWAKEQHAIIYAHNGGKFDWHFLIDHFEPFTRIMTISGRVAKVPFGAAELRDSYSILPVPLAEMQKDDFDYRKLHKSVRAKHMPEIRKYLKSDCVNLFTWVSNFIEQYGRNLTVASAALAQWRKISKMDTPRTSEGYYQTLSEYYYGGRVQCFAKGHVNSRFRVIDINSAYPAAMMKRHPWGESYIVSDELPKNGIERCFITLECEPCGAFPVRTENGLDFPFEGDRRKFSVTGWEYLAALETGVLGDHAIEKVFTFPASIEFSDYINHFYEIKEASEKGTPSYLFAKLFMNSLYGKFGSNPARYKEQWIVPPEHVAAASAYDGYTYAGELGKNALMERPLAEKARRYFNVAVAASITGAVRAEMFKAISQCKGVLYCDTDSIAAEDIGGLELHPTRLGAWDVEADCDRASIVAKKIYAFRKLDGKYKTASKGVRLSPEQIIAAADGEEVLHKNEAPSFSLKKPFDKFDPEEVKKLYIGRRVRLN